MSGGQQDIRALVHALAYPQSNDAYLRDQQTLTDLYKQPGFFLALQQLAGDRSLDTNDRLLSSIISGRELKTKWRSKSLVPEHAKSAARELLFSFLAEDNLQLGLLVAVARIEYPRTFPNLPQLLLNPLSTSLQQLHSHASTSNASTVLLNTLWTINALVKEWRTVKVAAGQEAMKALEEAFVPPVQQVLDMWAERERNGGADWVLGEAGRYAFKILARFSQWHWAKAQGLQNPQAIERIRQLVQQSVSHAPLLQQHRVAVIQHPPQVPPDVRAKLLHGLLKHLRAIGKWWRVMIELDAKGFCAMEGVTAGVGWWWGEVGGVVAGSDGAVDAEDDDDVTHPKRFLLLGMLLFKDILPILAVQHLDIFTPEFVLSAFHLLIDKLLPLTHNDLERLEDEPEEWLIGEDNDEEAWKFEFRPCAERVLMALNNACRHFPKEHKVIEPEMLKVLHEAEALPPNDMKAILRRESVYCALGRLSRSLSSYGGVDFNAFLQHSSSWLNQGIPLHRILKRRLAWLIGHWVGAEEESAKLPLVWQILVHLIAERGESSDMAVRLTAAVAIKESVDLWELDIEYFVPYLEQTASELVKLLGEASMLSGKRYVNETLGVVIERVQDKILPYLPALAQAVPTLWNGAVGLEGEWLFKASLVVLTTKLVAVAKESAGGLMDLVIPLIQESLVPPAKDFFEEDGVLLWQTALHGVTSPYTPTPETGLIKLFPGLMGLLTGHADLIDQILRLLDSYICLDPAGVIQAFGPTICANLYTNLSNLKPNSDQAKRVLLSISYLVRSAPIHAVAPLLLDSDLFQFSLKALEDDTAAGLVLAAHLEIMGRIAMSDANVFLQMVAEAARRENKDGHKMLEEALDALWRNFDYVGDREGRKTVAMGVGALLTTGNQQCLERLDGEFMNIFLDVLGEMHEQPDTPETAESLKESIVKDNSYTVYTSLEGTAELSRRVQQRLHDPIYVTPLKTYIVDCLTRAQAVGLGPYWDKADQGTKHSLEKFLS